MNPRDLLETANDLAAGVRESDWRSAISRAYYAAFHVAIELLDRCGFTVPRSEQAHAYLWMRLSNSGHPDVIGVGHALTRLRTDRNTADYHLYRGVTDLHAMTAVMRADDIIRTLDAAARLPTVLAQITAAMRDYERDVLREVTWRP